jgi:hypothetical protein
VQRLAAVAHAGNERLEEEFGSVLFHSERANTHVSALGKTLVQHGDSGTKSKQSAADTD